MKRSIAVAAFLVIAGSAAGGAALVSPYRGSDSLYDVTNQAIQAAGLNPLNAYVGGGSGDAQWAMTGLPFSAAAAKQQTGPMARMIDSGDNVCSFNQGRNGSADTGASSIVIGLDAVAVLASVNGVAQSTAACNGAADNAGSGLAASGTTGVFANGNAGQNWKWILALAYGGKDLSNPSAAADCASPARKNLVNNWRKLMQGEGCTIPPTTGTNTAGFVCNQPPISGQLWHAFRLGDKADASHVFASILGLWPLPSVSAVNGFGTSPYCNALNWDTSTSNTINPATGDSSPCQLGANRQFVGPGGVPDPLANEVIVPFHRRPPPGTWGDNPDPGQGALGADVLPTQFQDNDPIRRPCIGGTTGSPARAGEEVCNLDGALGLVLPMVDSDWMPRLTPPLQQYPINACNTFLAGKPVTVFTCALRGTGTKHSGECPNGDALIGGGCLVPVDTTNNTSQCLSTKAQVAALQNRALGNPDGRHYNVQMRDGTVTEPFIGYAQYSIPSLGSADFNSVDFAGGYNRIHQQESILGAGSAAAPAGAAGCQLVDMNDQIDCLAQSDPCSIGYASGSTFASRSNPGHAQKQLLGSIGALRVAQIAPSPSTVQKLGLSGAYPVSHKIYFGSLVGFSHVGATSSDPGAADELALAGFVAQTTGDPARTTTMQNLITNNGFFELGAQGPAGANVPFCEDFNEQTVCNPTPVSRSTLPANVNACATNAAAHLPTASTICGNGIKEAYEECDNGTANGTTGNGCSLTCRCLKDFNNATGACN
jgi:cysteine-rich repeat protein